MVLHCLFLHFAVPSTADERYWNIAADIVVEKMIDSLKAGSVKRTFLRTEKIFIRQ